jgi:hypothetical protein
LGVTLHREFLGSGKQVIKDSAHSDHQEQPHGGEQQDPAAGAETSRANGFAHGPVIRG